MSSTRRARLLRGVIGGSTATFVALLSHLAGGGAVPGLLGIGVPWILSLAVCVALAGRRLSAPRLAVSVALSQFLFHALFTLGAPPASVTTPTGHHAAESGLGILLTGTPLTAAPDIRMVIGHATALAITTVALHRAERAVQRVARFAVAIAMRVSHAIATRLGTPLARPRSVPPARQSRGTAPWDAVRRLAPDRRGPPITALP